MGYRGDDLDLRTPQTWSIAPESAGEGFRGRPAYGAQRGGPISVDETVLAACNHAFEVALAHRAGEVTLDHLLHALTRIDEAAEVLEARGVRVAGLRRETATVVASEIPPVLVNGKGTPRRSDELEETLRLAAGAASRHDAPAGVEDLLRAMVEVRPDLAPVVQPARAVPRYTGSYHEPAAAGRSFIYEAQERPRGYAPAEPARRERAEASRPDLSPTDTIQNSRLEALEQMVRALSNDLASERKVFSGVLQDMQREVMAQRDDMSRYSGAAPERLSGEISDRMQGLERAMMGIRPQAVDLNPVLDRLAAIEQSLLARAASPVDLSPIANRLDIIEEAVLSHEPSVLMGLNNRLKVLEEGVAADRTRAAEAHDALMAEIKSLAVTVDAAVERRLAAVTADVGAVKADASTIGAAIGTLDTSLGQRLDRLTSSVESTNGQAEAWLQGVDNKLASIEQAAVAAVKQAEEREALHAQQLTEVHEALVKLNGNQHTLAGSIGEWRREGTTHHGELAARVTRLGTLAEGIELNLGGMGNGLAGFGRSLMDVDARIGGVDSMLSGMTTRLDRLEKESAKPLAMLETVSGTLDNMHKVTVERYYRRNRFWYWLFGTDDWVAASWPSQAARIVDDLKAVRTVAKK